MKYDGCVIDRSIGFGWRNRLRRFVFAIAVTGACSVFAEDDETVVAKDWNVLPAKSVESQTPPDFSPARWGKWSFGDEPSGAASMFQDAAVGDGFTPPNLGFEQSGWRKYHVAWLRAKKDVPSSWRGKRVFFVMDGARGESAKLFVNERKPVELDTPDCRIEVTGLLDYGAQNEFVILLDGGRNGTVMMRKGPPRLVSRDVDTVDDIRVTTSWREKKLAVDVRVTLEKPKPVVLIVKVLDRDGKEVKTMRETVDLPEGTTVLNPSVQWNDPIPWEFGKGYLYTLKTTIRFGMKEHVCKDIRFGFREFWREGRKILLNGHEQKLNIVRDFGCNAEQAKQLTGLGFNVIDFRRTKESEMALDVGLLEKLSEAGIGVIAPVAVFDRNAAVEMTRRESWREDVKRDSAKLLQKYRNWPCFVMHTFGTDAYSPKFPGDPAHFGDEDTEPFPKVMNEYAAAARTVNSNVLYSSESDGALGDMESVSLAYDLSPICEWEDRLTGWAARGKLPFRVRGFTMPKNKDWYRDKSDCVTEILAAYYGDEAYDREPDWIKCGHLSNSVECASHPLVGEMMRDFHVRVNRAWRFAGVNCGIDWTGLVPDLDGDFLKPTKKVPEPKCDWELPAWKDIKSANAEFLGWIAGSPRIVDRRHAYRAGETVEKQCVMVWDGIGAKTVFVEWKVVFKKKVLASGKAEKRLGSCTSASVPIRFAAPAVKRPVECTLKVRFFNSKHKAFLDDSIELEMLPEAAPLPGIKKLNTAKTRVIKPFSIKGPEDLPWDEIKNGLKVLVLPQSAEVMKSLGFEIDSVVPRRLSLRDRVSPAFADLTDDDLRDWYGQPGSGPLFSNNALCGFLLRTPDSVGYLPVIEGGFDGDSSAVLRRFIGKGEIIFSMLSTTDRVGLDELKGASVSDPCAEKTAAALYADLLLPAGPAHIRKAYPADDYSLKLTKDYGLVCDPKGVIPTGVVICGPDSEISVNDVISAVHRGSNVLIIDNSRLSKGLGLEVEDKLCPGVYRVKTDPANPDLRSIGANVFRFRDRVSYKRITGGTKDWKVDADGMFASRTYREGGKVFVLQFDPYRFKESVRKGETRIDMTIRHHRQFMSRILTLLGARPLDK